MTDESDDEVVQTSKRLMVELEQLLGGEGRAATTEELLDFACFAIAPLDSPAANLFGVERFTQRFGIRGMIDALPHVAAAGGMAVIEAAEAADITPVEWARRWRDQAMREQERPE